METSRSKRRKLVNMMVVAMDWMMHARENKTDLNLAIETIVDAWMQFNGNDIYC